MADIRRTPEEVIRDATIRQQAAIAAAIKVGEDLAAQRAESTATPRTYSVTGGVA